MAKTIAAGIFIIRRDKKLLVCHPTNHAADFWSIPKGKTEEGETMIQTALRETFEETNLDLNTTDAILSFNVHAFDPINYGHKKKMIYPFVFIENIYTRINWDELEIKCNSNVALERGGFPEMDDYKWATLEEAKPLLHETQAACIDKIKELIN